MLVFLTGFMGSGKTTIGKKLAKKLTYKFIDLDAAIEKQEQKTILQIFEQQGEEYFRLTEHNTLKELANSDKLVVSCGGGTPCFHHNMELMNSMGLTIYIKLSAAALFSRLKLSKNTRPLLRNLAENELNEFIQSKLNEREQYYQKSEMVIDGLRINLLELVNLVQLKT